MRVLIVAVVLAVAAAAVASNNVEDFLTGKSSLDKADLKTKEKIIAYLLRHMSQPTMYDGVRQVAREFKLENSKDLFVKPEVVKEFYEMYEMRLLLPRGEAFTDASQKHEWQGMLVFRVLYFAKDFDTFVKTACWLRDRINSGMFVFALTAAVYHRKDCRGIVLPAPYEIFPNLFVGSDVIQRAFNIKMTNGHVDGDYMKYWGIRVTDKKVCYIDSRRGTRFDLSIEDRLSYFTEDVDLNTYMYNLRMSYPTGIVLNKPELEVVRRGEIFVYGVQQLLARYDLERLGRGMCRTEMMNFDSRDNVGYWPNMRLRNGFEMPMRPNKVQLFNKYNLKYKMYLEDLERMLRLSIMTGRIVLDDGISITLTKPEDFEYVCRFLQDGGITTGLYSKNDSNNERKWNKFTNTIQILLKFLSRAVPKQKKNTLVPTATDISLTALRDPMTWRLLKRYLEPAKVFKRILPSYKRKDFDFPGVKIEKIFTDKLVTFIDDYEMDITDAVMLNDYEFKKGKGDWLYVARQRRVNTYPFKVTMDVFSEKTIDAVVRVFIGPKFDCMGRVMSVNEQRKTMVEIDSFLYKLETGKNTIVRKSTEMHGVIEDRPMMRKLMSLNEGELKTAFIDAKWWMKSRIGFPHRLVLPLGTRGGLKLQIFAVVTPIREGMGLPVLDMQVMRQHSVCRWTTCIDSMPLGFPFDRKIDMTHFYTPNMKFQDITVYRKDVDVNNSKEVDYTYMKMRRDDLTYYDMDMVLTRKF